MLDYTHLQTLAEVLRAGSFEEAAARLGVTPPAVSQRIRALEERLGTTLIRRGPPATATDMGARLARHAEDVALMERDLLGGLGQADGDRPVIRLAVNADSLATWVLPALATLDGFLFDLVIDDQDHSTDWLKRGEVMAAITAHGAPIAGCDAHPLGALRYLACASPAFMARWFPGGVTVESLGAAPALIFNSKDKLQGRWAKSVLGARAAFRGHVIASAEGFVTATRLSLGWGMLPEAMISDDLAAGRIVPLVPGTPLDVPLFWQVSRLPGASLPRLTKAIRQAARTVLVAA
ncbi:MAG TPA: LysR family transcriptional regulator ArgP [Albidovulum sp.]|uniref:LysR family transcriptional regulator ArgP n=1 Tax=Albidovulum sp. TaxID=1872424 RepID=UPI002CC80EC2|nr:LysR family transcriptional regulator ArgP [Albidovulum sp.]